MTNSSSSSPTPIILDCDPGHDDAIAILTAVGSPSVDLRAVTTVFGNCPVTSATRNALQVLSLAGAEDVPVAEGASEPLVGRAHFGNYVHGVSGLDGPKLPSSGVEKSGHTAVQLIVDELSHASEPVTIVAIGPLTNIANVLTEYPKLVDKVQEVIFMGGSTERGNHTPYAEFNTYADPEALDILLKSDVTKKMVGLNLTHQALATPEVVQRMQEMQHRVGKTAAEWMGFFGSSYKSIWEFDAPPVHDPCTVASLIVPDLIEWRDSFVAVETEGTWTRGATVVDLYRRWEEHDSNTSVAITLDVSTYWDTVLAAIDSIGGGSSGSVA